MMNGRGFRSYQCMNMVHRSKDGHELWLGDYMAASNISLLKKKNIQHVLTSAAMLDINYSKQHNINHKIINAFDVPTYKITPHFEEAYRFIDDSLKKGHLLVHCAAGISRSTTFVLVYLMRNHNMSFQHGLGYVRSKRSVVNPNYGFQNELKKYELELRKNNNQGMKEEEATTLTYDSYKDKKATFQFMSGQQKRPLASQQKQPQNQKKYMTDKRFNNWTISGLNTNPNLRGKSVTYQTKDKMQTIADHKTNINRLAKGLMNYKMEVPRLLQMKK